MTFTTSPATTVNLSQAGQKTLVAATRQLVLAENTKRKYLLIQNTGTNPASFGDSSVVAGGGFVSLDPPSVTTGQGGSMEFTVAVPSNAIYAISTAGTTIVISEASYI